MRLHHLEATAFGPFPETVRVDFDALSEAGLFLLAGPTGAGKSSVLDAVCFALYGDVPGDRASARRLRCDQATEGVAPRVLLEATLAGRRYRIDRSPAWTRPKRRGTGTTTEHARVVLSERIDGDWVPLSTRLDETGHLINHRVGLTLAQFCQVAMLPQGRFQAFLRARSEERHALLQQVFRTGRFDEVEKWLRERRVALRRTSGQHEETVADLVSRLSEVAATPAPDAWQEDPGSLSGWTAALVTDAAAREERAGQQHQRCRRALEVAEADAEAGRLIAAAQRRHADAVAELARLASMAEEVGVAGARLQVDRRAITVHPLLILADDARRRAEGVTHGLARALTRVSTVLGEDLDPGQLPTLRQATVAALGDAARVRPVQERLVATREAEAVLVTAMADLEARLARVEHRVQVLPSELEEERAALAAAEAADARVAQLTSRLAELRERRSAHLTAEGLAAELVVAESDLAETVTALQSAKETWLDVREQRLDGMAAEIASALVVGGCCPVCGSADHPSPAPTRTGAPDAAAERAARRRVDDLEATTEAHAQHVRDLATRVAGARALAGDAPEAIPTALTAAAEELAAVRALAGQADDVRRRLAVLVAGQAAAAAELAGLRVDLAGRESERARLDALAAELHAQVRDVLDGCGHDRLDDLTDHLTSLDEACRQAEAARDAAARADHARGEAEAAAQGAAVTAGFDTLADAAAGVLSDADREHLATRVEEHRRAHVRATDTLGDPEVAAAADLPEPDLTFLEQAHRSAREDVARTRRTHETAEERHRRVAGLGRDLGRAVAAWQPVRDELELTAGLASFVEGRSSDNRLQMRLSAYVLAHRLAQVVAGANLRLGAMSDQRYSLVHTGRRGAGESRGGLSLLVRDDWSGETRDPATLSGGETFVVSLALALGLADVISAEAGGADLDTLFVDEGFGSLDADTLDDVMDTLDSLRDGGRVVGVVSHVPELQTRIPTQLRVHKARHGSRTSLRLG